MRCKITLIQETSLAVIVEKFVLKVGVSQQKMADKSCFVQLPKMGGGGSSGVPTAKSSDYLFGGASNEDYYIPMHDKQESRLPKNQSPRAAEGAKPRTGGAATGPRTSDYLFRKPTIEEQFFPMDQRESEPFLNQPAPAVKRSDQAKPSPSKPKPRTNQRFSTTKPRT